MFRFPYVVILVPLAAPREEVRGSAVSQWEAGNTQASAPESTRNSFRVLRSQIVIVLVEELPAAATKNGRHGHFPERSEILKQNSAVAGQAAHSSWGSLPLYKSRPWYRIWHGSGRVQTVRGVMNGVAACSALGRTAGGRTP